MWFAWLIIMAESTVRWFVVREKHCWMVSCMWALSRWYAWSINGSCSINPMSLGHHVDGVKPLVVQWSGNTYYQEFRMPSSVVAQTGVFPWSLCSGLTTSSIAFTCHQFTCFELRSKGPPPFCMFAILRGSVRFIFLPLKRYALLLHPERSRCRIVNKFQL